VVATLGAVAIDTGDSAPEAVPGKIADGTSGGGPVPPPGGGVVPGGAGGRSPEAVSYAGLFDAAATTGGTNIPEFEMNLLWPAQ